MLLQTNSSLDKKNDEKEGLLNILGVCPVGYSATSGFTSALFPALGETKSWNPGNKVGHDRQN